MKNIINILLAFMPLALLSTACEYRIELKGEGVTEKLFVECYPGKEEKCAVRLQKAIPANGNSSDVTIPQNVTMEVSVNGTPVEVRHVEDNSYESYYSFDYKASSGDMIRMEIAADGVQSVMTEGIIPDAPEITGIRQYTTREYGPNVISVSIADNPQKDDFYTLELYLRKTEENYYKWYPDDEPDISTSCDTTAIRLNRLYDEPITVSPDDSPIPLPDKYIPETLMFNDKSFRNGARTFSIEAGYDRNIYNQYPKDVPLEEVKSYQKITFEYKVVIRSIAPEYFRYVKVRRSMDESEFSGLGWAPSFYAFTNISNGIGIMGTVNTWESAWLQNDFGSNQ